MHHVHSKVHDPSIVAACRCTWEVVVTTLMSLFTEHRNWASQPTVKLNASFTALSLHFNAVFITQCQSYCYTTPITISTFS